MTNFIEYVDNQTAGNFVDTTSRYLSSDVIRWGDKKLVTFETYKRSVKTQNPRDRFFLIEAGHEYRPDLVSQIAYGFPDWWWQILEANNMMDVFEFKAGKTIRVPSNIG